MASPRSTATFNTANSQFELEDTSNQDIIIASIPEVETPSENKHSICDIPNEIREQQPGEQWTELPELTLIQNIIHEESSFPVVNTLRQDFGWNANAPTRKEVPRTYEQVAESRAKAQYYSKAFAVREVPNFSRERLLKTSVLTAEIKTNVVVSLDRTYHNPISQLTFSPGSRRIQFPYHNICFPCYSIQ